MKKLILKIAVLFVILSQNSYSEDKTFGIGVTSGTFWAINDVKYLYDCASCFPLNDFTSNDFFWGMTTETKFLFPNSLSFLANVYYSRFSYLKKEDGGIYPALVSDGNGVQTLVNAETIWERDGSYSLLSMDLLLKYKIPVVDLSFSAGVSLGYLLNSHYAEYYKIISPNNAQFTRPSDWNELGYEFLDNGRVVRLYNKEIPYKNDFRIGLKAGINYDFMLWDYSISPFVYYDFPLTSVVYDRNRKCVSICPDYYKYTEGWHWKISYLSAGIDFKYWL